MRRFSSLLAAAGLGHFSPLAIMSVLGGVALLTGLLVWKVVGLSGLAIAAAVLALLALLEVLGGIAKRRKSVILEALPQVVEAIQSAVSAGIGIPEAFADLATLGPVATRRVFDQASAQLSSGVTLSSVLDWIKRDVGSYQCDQLCELLRLAQTSGGMSLARNLSELAQHLRTDAATLGEISAKQGWVVGTAKLALATPWVVVAMLGQRAESASQYNSELGVALLLGGLLLCLSAFVVIQRFARLPEPKRVFEA